MIELSQQAETKSRLRLAREGRNWTLRRAVEEIEGRAARSTGLTESLVSQWERGKVRPGMYYRGLLCEVYEATPQDLGFQTIMDGGDSAGADDLRLITSHDELVTAMVEVVRGAQECLAVTGSRSREASYLAEIEHALSERPRVVHYRLLFGPPRRQVLKDHLVRLVTMRNPADREAGVQRLYLGIIDDVLREPERFIVASESVAVLGIPSLITAGNFDTGVVFSRRREAQGFVQHVKQIYAGTRRLEGVEAVRELPVVA